jgi:hypothetical protein
MSDYLVELDLNSPAGPINNPLDPRAMRYFGFLSEGQEISLVQPFNGTPRIFISWHHGYQSPGAPQPAPLVDAVLDFSGGPPTRRWEGYHDRRHVIVWLDPTSPPVTGSLLVRIMAWNKE